jgi:eukaryotic-like serine/threonine-protein kinase
MFDQVAQYRILERIGADNLGETYRARDSYVGRTVVLRMLPDSLAGDAEWLARFRRDVQATAAVSHPNIAAVYELAEDHGRVWLATEYAPGETLLATMGGQPINPRRAVDIAAQLADALAEGHAHGIVHGHLTPAAVIVTTKSRAKVLDFGLAVQAVPRDEIDERDDILALGAILFEMLTGTLPSALNRPLAPDFDRVVRKMLAADPAARYQSAAGLAADLRSVASVLEARRSASERR